MVDTLEYNGQDATVLITPPRPRNEADGGRHVMPTGHRTTTPRRSPDGSKIAASAKDWRRFWAKVQKQPNGCWIWTGCRSRYGIFGFAGRHMPAHRFAYRAWQSTPSIPDDRPQLDHLCRNPFCVNPDHLEPVTNRANSLRGLSMSAVNFAKTHCVRGHAFTMENTRLKLYRGRLNRNCRACHLITQRLKKQRRKRERELLMFLQNPAKDVQ